MTDYSWSNADEIYQIILRLAVSREVTWQNVEFMTGFCHKSRIFWLQTFTKYFRPALVFMWNSALREKFDLFFRSFLLILTKFLFWQEDWALGYHSMKFWDFPEIFYFRKILSLNPFGNSRGNSYILDLLLIIALRFTCSERKIW